MPSAAFSVNGTAYSQRVAVAGGSTVNLALLSTTGVNDGVQWIVESNSDPNLTNPTITTSGSPTGSTASFTMPAGENQGYQIRCVINSGVDANGAEVESYTARGIVGVLGPRGIIPFVLGEKLARHPTYGWGIDFNTGIGLFDPVATLSDTATTSDATPEPFTAYTPTADGVYLVAGIFEALDQNTDDAVAIVTLAAFKVISGTCTRLASPSTTFSVDETAGVTVDVDTDGTDIIPEATGIVATDLDWSFTGQVSYLLRP